MSARENRWYVFGSLLQQGRSAPVARRVATVALWAAMVAGLAFTFRVADGEDLAALLQDAAWLLPLLAVGGGVAAFVLARLFWSRKARAARDAYRAALQHPDPERLVAVVDASMRAAGRLPDLDALQAQARAMAYALYGRGGDALRALGGVAWSARAPLIQAIGVGAEAITALLCDRDPGRALELARRAQALGATQLPGSAENARHHATGVAACEAVRGEASAAALRVLDEEAENDRFPPRQLLAALGRAVEAERVGDQARASALRDRIARLAPHCAPLRLGAADFTRAAAGDGESPDLHVAPATPSALVAGRAAGDYPREVKAQLGRWVARKLVLWAALVVVFLVLWSFFQTGR